MHSSLWLYFTDPVLQAPTLASMLMCLSSALIGVIVFLRKRSLLGEALCHATYPGVVLSALVCSFFFSLSSDSMIFAILTGAFLTVLLGLFVIERLEERFRVRADTALCFVIALFFGVGVLLASRIQFTHVLWYKAVQLFLYGQAATMVDVHVVIYGVLALLMVLILALFFYPIRMVIFDKNFSKSMGVSCRLIEGLLSTLLALAIVIGIRSVGVVLMSGMLIAPAVAARQLSHRLRSVFLYAASIGAISGFLGNYFSLEIPYWVGGGRKETFSLPTGPMILLSSVTICVGALLFAPQNGLLSRLFRIMRFKRRCQEENVLKYLWKQNVEDRVICRAQHISYLSFKCLLKRLKAQGWIERGEDGLVYLTRDGHLKSSRIVRLHRLWEAYLVSLGQGIEKVHRSAEEMEHIITPELEKKLSDLLGDPRKDPHAQPIPAKDDTL